MRLEKIEALTEEKLVLHLEDGSSLRCGPQELLDFGLRPGMELGEEVLERLRGACAYWAVRRKAAALVARTGCAAKDLDVELLQRELRQNNVRLDF